MPAQVLAPDSEAWLTERAARDPARAAPARRRHQALWDNSILDSDFQTGRVNPVVLALPVHGNLFQEPQDAKMVSDKRSVRRGSEILDTPHFPKSAHLLVSPASEDPGPAPALP